MPDGATKTWETTSDNPRPAHEDADGQEVPIDEPFDVDGEDLDYPGDPNGSDGNVINCMCIMSYDYGGAAEGEAEGGGAEEEAAPEEETEEAPQPEEVTPPVEAVPEAAEIPEGMPTPEGEPPTAPAEATGMPAFESVAEVQDWTNNNLDGNINFTGIPDGQTDYATAIASYAKEVEDNGLSIPDIRFDDTYLHDTGSMALFDPKLDEMVLPQMDISGYIAAVNEQYQAANDTEQMVGASEDMRGMFFHEYAHYTDNHAFDIMDTWNPNDPGAMSREEMAAVVENIQSHAEQVMQLSPDEKDEMGNLSAYAEKTVGIGDPDAHPGPQEAYSEAASAIAQDSPLQQYIPDSIRDAILKEYPWLGG